VQQETGEKRLRGSKCDRCGRIAFPAMAVCPKCGPTHPGTVQPVELPSAGTVVTWTVLHVAPKGFPSPLVHCILDLGGVKILGTFQGSPEIQSGEVLRIVEDPTGKFPFVFTRPTAKPTQGR
jgi:uncharacterized OB-fold protein